MAVVVRKLWVGAKGVGGIRLSAADNPGRNRKAEVFYVDGWPRFLREEGELSFSGVGFDDRDGVPHIAWGERDEVVALLRQHGYIIKVGPAH